MTRLLTTLLFVLLTGAALAGPPLTLTLPDDGRYSYWIQARTGAVSALPVNVSHQTNVSVNAPLAAGDRLILLDASTGQWAQQVVTLGADGQPAPIVFALGDFHPLTAPVSAAPVTPITSETDTETASSPWLITLLSLAAALSLAWLAWFVWTRARTASEKTAERAISENRDSDMILMPGHHGPPAFADETGRFVSGGEGLQRGPEMPMATPAALIGVQGLVAGSTFTLTAGNVTIGRDGENEIVLAENTVSRYHARLLRQDNGQFALTDLGSANGVYVNGQRVQRAILHPGDQIKVGDNYFRFQVTV